MPTTKTYKFDSFIRGSYYSASLDLRRFVTLDYNMSSFIGIVGVGIIEGWNIQQGTGLNVKITPGSGMINGYASESPYVVKQRSSMVSGDWEINALQSEIPEAYLTNSQKTVYVNIVREYNPTYSPPDYIENSFVKVSRSENLTLTDNAKNYIFVTRKSTTAYPPLTNYPSALLDPPNPNNYESYSLLQNDVAAYQAQQNTIANYHFYNDEENRFTEVEFNISSSFVASSDKILLGKVTTRNGQIINIDLSGVEKIAGLQSSIQKYLNVLNPKHIHGGSKSYDPQKIVLTTDIRKAVLKEFTNDTKTATYQVLEKNETSLEQGHTHTYYLDANGDGVTVNVAGSGAKHFHEISKFLVKDSQLTTEDPIPTHTHTISNISDTSWVSDSQYQIYVNNKVIGDNSSTNINVNSSNKTIAMSGVIGGVYKTYSSSFNINAKGIKYSYVSQQKNLYKFMLSMQLDFEKKHGTEFTSQDDLVNYHPFFFLQTITSPTGESYQGVVGLQPLANQCLAGETFLQAEGNTFTFRPNAAKSIVVTLSLYRVIKGSESDDVKIELFGNSEVTGKLKLENIVFINADKFSSGEFQVSQIPFISHMGRINETSSPFKYGIITTDGIKYSVTSTITSVNKDHYHSIIVDVNGNGTTNYTYIGDEAVLYTSGTDGSQYYVAHQHTISKGVLNSATSDGLDKWLVSLGQSASGSHNHIIPEVVTGDSKVVYSIKEDRFGNIYTGTSNGLLITPVDNAYIFVINGVTFYEISSSLWGALNKAKADYEKETLLYLNLDQEIYAPQIIEAELNLQNNGDTYILYGKSTEANQDVIMIKRVESFEIPNFVYQSQRELYEIASDEYPVDVIFIDKATGETVDPEDPIVKSLLESSISSYKILAIVDKFLNYTPINNINIKSRTINSQTDDYIGVSGANAIALNSNLQNSFYNLWKSPTFPINTSVVRKVIVDSDNNSWGATDKGVIVARDSSSSFSEVKLPSLESNVNDILEGDYHIDVDPALNSPSIYVANFNSIYITINGGKTWSELFDAGCKILKIIRDYKKDISDYNAIPNWHNHTVDVNQDGNGLLSNAGDHEHIVSNGIVLSDLGHTHSIILTLYIVDEYRRIYKSIDSGITWNMVVTLPGGEYSDVFVFDDNIFVAKPDGLYKLVDNSWTNIFSKTVYSFGWNYDLHSFFIGLYNNVYEYDINTNSFVNMIQFDGSAQMVLLANNQRQYFGYNYSNLSKLVYFNKIDLTGTSYSAYINYEKWFAQNKGWDSTNLYDIYINDYLIKSTKSNVNNVGTLFKDDFTVTPTIGLMDFSIYGKITQDIPINASSVTITYETDRKFVVGDKILIKTTINAGTQPSQPVITENTKGADAAKQLINYAIATKKYFNLKIDILNMYYYTTIIAIDGNNIYFESPCEKEISQPSTIAKIVDFDINTDILLNIYQSKLLNSGTNTHAELEDKLSIANNFMSMQFSNTHMANILQLTQAVRYVYSNIHETLKNSNFYDFKYSNNPLDDNYIGKYIDDTTSEIYNKGMFTDKFISKRSKNINYICIGTGKFSNNVIACTDIGVFVSKEESDYEGNWFYIFDIPYVSYSAIIFKDTLLVTTSNGVYETTDLVSWTRQENSSILFPAFSTSYRWPNSNVIVIPSHSCYLYNDVTDASKPFGVMQASSDLYNSISPNRVIKIEIISDPSNVKNGYYTVNSVIPNRIILKDAFPGDSITSNITINMSSWWQGFTGDSSSFSQNIDNPVVVGGENRIAINSNNVWKGASIDPNIGNINVVKLLPLTSGEMIASGIGNEQFVNYLMSATDLGLNWASLMKFPKIDGTVIGYPLITNFGHTRINVGYASGSFVFDGKLDKHEISFFSNNSLIYKGYIVENIQDINSDTMTIYNSDLFSLINNKSNITFNIYPTKINTILEAYDKKVYFGTDIGLYQDLNTVSLKESTTASIYDIGVRGNVYDIDFTGTVKYINQNIVNGNVLLSIQANVNVTKDQFIGSLAYLVNQSPIKSYKILSNTVKYQNNEVQIELDAQYDISWGWLIGNSITIVGSDNSKVYVDFKRPVTLDEFKDGNLIITTHSSTYDNIGVSYKILSNTSEYVTIAPIIPGATDALRAIEDQNASNADNASAQAKIDCDKAWAQYNIDLANSEKNGIPPPTKPTCTQGSSSASYTKKIYSDDLFIGQGITLFSSKIEIPVLFDRNVDTNEFMGFSSDILDSSSNVIISDIPIASNRGNKIFIYSSDIVKYFSNLVKDASSFSGFKDNSTYLDFLNGSSTLIIRGILFKKVPSFNNKTTTIEIDHYHDTNLVNQVISGDISSISTTGTSEVVIDVANINGFDNPIIQMQNDLLNGAIIRFYNKGNLAVEFSTYVVSHNSTSITVLYGTSTGAQWDFDAYNSRKISIGWSWSIDATNYGYTNNIYYKDFINQIVKLSQLANSDSLIVNVDSTSGIILGDKIRIVGGSSISEINYVDNILSLTQLKLKYPTSHAYLLENGSYVEVLKATFTNNHVHQIRNNVVDKLNIDDYIEKGYSISHSHRSISLINSVYCLEKNTNTIFISGSSDKIYKSKDNGNTWVALPSFVLEDLETEGSYGVTSMRILDATALVGTTNGYIYNGRASTGAIVKLEQPVVT